MSTTAIAAPTEPPDSTVQQILESMHEEGWRDTEIAKRLKVNAMTIFRWRHGKARPRYPVFALRRLRFIRSEFGTDTKHITP